MDDRLLAFIGVSIAVVVIPGPDMALIARNVLRHGRSAGFATSAGVCTGILGWAVAAALGVSTLLATSATAFMALKLAGAAYLIYLGIATLRGDHDGPDVASASERASLPWHRAWVQGLLSALLNPKLGVFFLTLLPQFISPGDPPATRSLQLAVVFDLIGLAWLLTYSAMLSALGAGFRRPGPRRFIRWLTGTILVGLGIRVALERT
jgi:threonine/homoserine/homoserine lactone efflux protein